MSLIGDGEKIDYFINNRQRRLDAFQKSTSIGAILTHGDVCIALNLLLDMK